MLFIVLAKLQVHELNLAQECLVVSSNDSHLLDKRSSVNHAAAVVVRAVAMPDRYKKKGFNVQLTLFQCMMYESILTCADSKDQFSLHCWQDQVLFSMVTRTSSELHLHLLSFQ